MFKCCDSCNTKHAIKYYHKKIIKLDKKRKNTIIITKKSLVNKIKNEKVKFLILKVKLAH